MFNNMNLWLMGAEIGLMVIAVLCLLLDLYFPHKMRRGNILSDTAMVGCVAIASFLVMRCNALGTLFGGSFVQDGFSVFFKVLFLIAAFFVFYMAKKFEPHLERGHNEFILLILFGLIGMFYLVSANDFLLLFVALETLTISFYIITAYLRTDQRSIEAGIKFLILGALSTALMIYGISFIYGATGSTSYVEIQKALMDHQVLPAGFKFGMILVFISLSFKIAATPFHVWVPDVYQGAPTPITAFLAMGSKAAAVGALARLLLTVFMPFASTFLVPLFSILATLTVLFGNLGAIGQTNIKRLLAYSSISHAGYLLMAFAAFEHTGAEATLIYLATYVFSTAGAFLVVTWIYNDSGSEEISAFAGLSQRSPVLAAGMLVALSSLAGVPPLAGFFGKFYILSAVVKAKLYWLAGVGLVNVVISLYYYFKIVETMYIHAPVRAGEVKVEWDTKMMQYLAMAGAIVMGIFPGPLVQLAQTALQNFLRF